MPFVRVEINQEVNKESIEIVMEKIADSIHRIKGDPLGMISVVIHTSLNISFGGNWKEPAAVVELSALDFTGQNTTQLAENISDILLEHFNVKAQRMYIFFKEIPHTQMHLVAWNRKTFADKTILADIKAVSNVLTTT